MFILPLSVCNRSSQAAFRPPPAMRLPEL